MGFQPIQETLFISMRVMSYYYQSVDAVLMLTLGVKKISRVTMEDVVMIILYYN